MNKNIIIGVLVIIVAVLGYFVVNGNSVMQQASTIKSQNFDFVNLEEQLAQFAKNNGGTIGRFTEKDLEIMANNTTPMSSISTSGGTNDRPYKCYSLMGDGGIYTYNYNSLYDHGETWVISATLICKAVPSL